MKLHLYQSIPYLASTKNPENGTDFYSLKNTLTQLHSHIRSFAGSSYSCREASVFGKYKQEKTQIIITRGTAGFSLTAASEKTVPKLFSKKTFPSGNYAFVQFNDSSPNGIQKAVNAVFDYIRTHQLQAVSDRIILRMVNEKGGILTDDLRNYALQVCIALLSDPVAISKQS